MIDGSWWGDTPWFTEGLTKTQARFLYDAGYPPKLLRQAADATWDTTITMEEFAEPNCFTTEAFQQTVRSMTEGP